MARQGVTYEQISAAAEGLLAEGLGVTVSSVRERLGTGSYSTISAHLSKWREKTKNKEPADIPDIPVSVDNAFRHVWALAWKEAISMMQGEREAIEAGRREMERERKDMGSEIARLEADIAELEEKYQQAVNALSEKDQAITETNSALQTLKIENARLEEKAKAQESRSQELKEELERMHKSLQDVAAKTRAGGRKAPKSTDE